MKKIVPLFILFFLPVVVFASAGEDMQTDIVQRSFNFVLFVLILYYLLADKIKAYFKNRTNEIKNSFENIEKLKKENEEKLSDARVELEKAKILSLKIVDEATSSCDTIEKKIIQEAGETIENMSKKFDESISVQTTKATKKVVDDFITDRSCIIYQK